MYFFEFSVAYEKMTTVAGVTMMNFLGMTIAAAAIVAPMQAQADTYVAADILNSVIGLPDGGGLDLSYDSRTGLAATPSGAAMASYSASSASPGTTQIALNSTLTGSGAHASGYAYSDLSTGILRAAGAGSQAYVGANQVYVLGSSISYAAFSDTIHFSVVGGGSQSFAIHGHVDGNVTRTTADVAGVVLDDTFRIGASRYEYRGSSNGYLPYDSFGYGDRSGAASIFGWDSYATENESVTGHDFIGFITVTDGETMDVFRSFRLDCTANVICDFSHTASLQFDLPTNVSFTSDSGIFLQPAAAAVPEPASWAMIIGGFGLAGATMRRRRVSLLFG